VSGAAYNLFVFGIDLIRLGTYLLLFVPIVLTIRATWKAR
jgi:hypothetical protein